MGGGDKVRTKPREPALEDRLGGCAGGGGGTGGRGPATQGPAGRHSDSVMRAAAPWASR